LISNAVRSGAVTQFPTYHDPFAANIPPAVTAIGDQAILLPFLCDGGNYVYFATTPDCGREHLAAIAELYRLQDARRALADVRAEHRGRVATPRATVARARTVTDARAALRLDAAPVKPTRKPRTVRARPPDGLRTKAEAAAKLGCSIKTLNGHVARGDLRYVDVGLGKKRVRRMFTDADLNEFITAQTRKDVACPPTSPKTVARRTSISTSKCEVIGFTARRNARRAAKPKK
jgi:hypothetical protein